ncbi:hypothetical protein L249_4447 [Ophiocordyceps polyrhachis-furcata BCC 54312]|uniref:Uncharacterized protein n=1 Tax=Ophiocordyceps polyrhachis-furcata BCC 54312 TaxID=1330021 RepID=A0A367L899_9HYPO|nr:hypothetical protein L249_4447 [Ophiocordyceps polyrhachis-furcata BCC 54312]
MALWPFRRKGAARKRPRSGAALSDPESPPSQSRAEPALTRVASKKKQRTEPAKLQRRPRSYSFSPSRRDSIRVAGRARLNTAAPASASRANGGAENQPWDRMPTLHHKTSQHPMRRKSSKRRRDDHEREAEIKAMSSLARPAGTLSKRSSKRAKTTEGGQWQKPASNVSLSLFDSIHSSQSSNESDCVSFKVSMLDALAPRPTLLCAAGSRWTPSRASAPTRSGSQKKSLAERDAIPEEGLDSRKRVDDLADGLDASDLRELMERDKRRRERKRLRDLEHTERKLARRAAAQQRDEDEARRSGRLPSPNLERGVLGRELAGLGIDPPSAVVTSSRKRDSPSSDRIFDMEDILQPREPLDAFQGADTLTGDQQLLEDEAATICATQPAVPVSALPQGSIVTGVLRSKKSLSKSTLSSYKDKTTLEEDAPRKGSNGSTKTGRLSFISFLRRGGRNRRSPGPSSFSNTSREEMQAAAANQADALARLQGEDASSQPPSRPGGGVPKRTRSRFREDLPDFPLSPPDSRVQSPEVELPLPVVDEVKTPPRESRPPSPAADDQNTVGARHFTPSERLHGVVSPDPQPSMSLASIDSEGSWLSGRMGSRRRSALRDSVARATRRDRAMSDSLASSTHEDVAVGDDDYLSGLAADRNSPELTSQGPSGDGRPSSDDEPMDEGDVRWGTVAGSKPRVVRSHRHDRDTMRSREGLLNCYPDSSSIGYFYDDDDDL